MFIVCFSYFKWQFLDPDVMPLQLFCFYVMYVDGMWCKFISFKPFVQVTENIIYEIVK